METRSFNSSPTLSLQRSYERLQVEADRLFDIGWLIARLTVELRQMLSAEPAPTPSQFFGSLRQAPPGPLSTLPIPRHILSWARRLIWDLLQLVLGEIRAHRGGDPFKRSTPRPLRVAVLDVPKHRIIHAGQFAESFPRQPPLPTLPHDPLTNRHLRHLPPSLCPCFSVTFRATE